MYDRDDCGTNAAHIPGNFAQLGETYSDLEGHACRAVKPQTGSEGIHGHRTYVDVRPQNGVPEDHRAPPTADMGEHDRKTCLKWFVGKRDTVKIARFVCVKGKYDVTYFWDQMTHGSIASALSLDAGHEFGALTAKSNAAPINKIDGIKKKEEKEIAWRSLMLVSTATRRDWRRRRRASSGCIV